ncbi:hypothetical protein GCM10023191_022030 [Actinoallomurus oryzae]|uniref:DUF3040 domain-containing protein n=1 Tax=Actinoallomurus oryzae TaxID=502180 RepID=A0ABP8PPK5_9ACTN
MTDPYRITEAQEVPPGSASHRSGIVRPVLWLLLVISAAGNMVTSTAGLNVFVGVAFGVATLACGTALIVQHYRQRRK